MFVDLFENLIKPEPKWHEGHEPQGIDERDLSEAEDSWKEDDIYNDTDEDPFDSDGSANRSSKK